MKAVEKILAVSAIVIGMMSCTVGGSENNFNTPQGYETRSVDMAVTYYDGKSLQLSGIDGDLEIAASYEVAKEKLFGSKISQLNTVDIQRNGNYELQYITVEITQREQQSNVYTRYVLLDKPTTSFETKMIGKVKQDEFSIDIENRSLYYRFNLSLEIVDWSGEEIDVTI